MKPFHGEMTVFSRPSRRVHRYPAETSGCLPHSRLRNTDASTARSPLSNPLADIRCHRSGRRRPPVVGEAAVPVGDVKAFAGHRDVTAEVDPWAADKLEVEMDEAGSAAARRG